MPGYRRAAAPLLDAIEESILSHDNDCGTASIHNNGGTDHRRKAQFPEHATLGPLLVAAVTVQRVLCGKQYLVAAIRVDVAARSAGETARPRRGHAPFARS